MKVRHLTVVGFVAAVSLLALVFSTWMKPFNIDWSPKQICHSEHLLCSVPTSSSVYVHEIRHRLTGIATGIASVFAVPLLLPQFKSVGLFEPRNIAVDIPRPLWLLHRSLLI